MYYTEKIRIYPNETQIKAIDQILCDCKELYNYLLDLNIRTYKKTGKGILGYDLDKYARKFIKKKIPSVAKQDVRDRLTDAFKRFFSHQNKFPKFKSVSKFKSFESSVVGKDGCHVFPNRSKIQFPTLGEIRAVFTRDFFGIPKRMRIKKYPSGKYYALITVDDTGYEPVDMLPRKPVIAIDLGVSKFFTDQNGNYISSPRFLRKKLKKLCRAQRELSRKQRGSKNYEKARIKVARLHEKVYNCRRDFHFKVAHYLVNTYEEVVCEDLRVKSMFPGKSRKDKLARRALYDVALASFLIVLQQMCEVYSCKLTKVDPQYTSQICSNCGTIVKKILSDRIHTCPKCGLSIDRDVNAARNILQRGKNISVGLNGRRTNLQPSGGATAPQLVEVLIPGIHPPKQVSKKRGSKLTLLKQETSRNRLGS